MKTTIHTIAGVLFLLFQINISFAQHFDWAYKIGTPQNEKNTTRIKVFPSGNFFLIGNPYHTINLSGTIVDSLEIFAIKYNTQAQSPIVNKSNGRASATALTTDSTGIIYLAGFNGVNTRFGTDTLSNTNTYFAKLDSGCNWIDAKNFQTCILITPTEVNGIALSDSNKIFVGGTETGPMSPLPEDLMKGMDYTLLTMIKDSVNYHELMCGGNWPLGSSITSVTADNSNNIYLSGQRLFTSSGASNLSLIKVNSNFEVLWYQTNIYPLQSLVKSNNNLLFLGGIGGVPTYGVDTIQINFPLTTNYFIGEMDSSGNGLWAKNLNFWSPTVHPQKIVTGSDNSIYVAGYFTDSVVFGNLKYTTSNGKDLFILKTDSTGNPIWLKKAGGFFDDEVSDLGIDANNNLYITGMFGANCPQLLGNYCYFDNMLLTSSGGADIYFAKLSQTPLQLEELNLSGQTEIYPNPANEYLNISFSSPNKELIEILFTDISGKTILSSKINSNESFKKIPISNVSQGMYFVNMKSKSQSFSKKFIKL